MNWIETLTHALSEENLDALASNAPHPVDSVRAQETQNWRWGTAATKYLLETPIATLAHGDTFLHGHVNALGQVLGHSHQGPLALVSAMTGIATLTEAALLKSASIEPVARLECPRMHPRIEVGPGPTYRAYEEPLLAAETQRRTRLPLEQSILLTRGLGQSLAEMCPLSWGGVVLTPTTGGEAILIKLA